ncbi:MAG TPA: caspase family protein, partial [Chitinophagaceae bacterium]|nr:caspase family protein [Chitinophagaceae bacterium]
MKYIITMILSLLLQDLFARDVPGNAEKRIALIIGNGEYIHGTKLKNPVNDANLMADSLKKIGFDIIKLTDADKSTFEKAVYEFSKKLRQYDIALFFYAGHGIQLDGINYLLPVDADLNEKDDVKFQSISVNFITEEFEKYPDHTSILILDACRNNPFRSWMRGAELGFKSIAGQPAGSIIAYATRENKTADD